VTRTCRAVALTAGRDRPINALGVRAIVSRRYCYREMRQARGKSCSGAAHELGMGRSRRPDVDPTTD